MDITFQSPSLIALLSISVLYCAFGNYSVFVNVRFIALLNQNQCHMIMTYRDTLMAFSVHNGIKMWVCLPVSACMCL